MKSNSRQDKARLLVTAKAVAERLKIQSEGTRIRIRTPRRISRPDTDGWRVVIGDLGKNQPRLEVWFDRFSGYSERNYWAAFTSYRGRRPIIAITKCVSRKLWPVRTLSSDDADFNKYFALRRRLGAAAFNVPIIEEYSNEAFFGFYSKARRTVGTSDSKFVARAVAFIEDVARSLPSARETDLQREIFPRCEDRKWVRSHLKRERSGYLAVECKIRDGYRCQACRMTFTQSYGKKLGVFFAESHHLKPLGTLGDSVRTKLEDLITVCANCHRMLHRMDGKPTDIAKLRRIIRTSRK